MNPGIEFEFAFLWNVVGQILILCRTCMMRKWSSIKTKTKPLARPGKKAVARSKHCRWILMPCCPISGKWGATRLIHICFKAKHGLIKMYLSCSVWFQLAILPINIKAKTFMCPSVDLTWFSTLQHFWIKIENNL